MSITPLQLTGVSSMSDTFQAILTRAVNIAQLPLQQLQNSDSDLLQEQTLLSGFSGAAVTLGNAVKQLGKLGSGGALSATSSNTAKLTAQNTGATSAAAHKISEITSLASAATARSGAFADTNKTPVSVDGKMQLKFNGKDYALTLKNNTLTGLQNAINGLGVGVTASILTAGPTTN